MREKRIQRLRQVLRSEGLDSLIITQPSNSLYLSGFGPSVQPDEIASALLITEEDAILLTGFLYQEQAEREAPDFRLYEVEMRKEGAIPRALFHLAIELGIQRLGFEAQHLTFARYEEWREGLDGLELVPTKGLVEGLRAVKDGGEIEVIRKAVALADQALAHIRGYIQPGLTEKEVAWEAEAYMRSRGAEKVAFDLIVASGPHGSMPHASTSERPIREGEPIIVDLGARVEGYHSDLTRTLWLGKPDPRFGEIYHLVLKAQRAAEEGIRAGMLGKEADALARQVIEKAGYEDEFGHGLGHGVGLAVHERPSMAKESEEELLPGMVVTVEPGIYIPGWGGVRIEDMVVIGQDGVEILTGADKEPVI